MCISESSDHILTYISVQPVLQLCSKVLYCKLYNWPGRQLPPAPDWRCGATGPDRALRCIEPSGLPRPRSPGLGHTYTAIQCQPKYPNS